MNTSEHNLTSPSCYGRTPGLTWLLLYSGNVSFLQPSPLHQKICGGQWNAFPKATRSASEAKPGTECNVPESFLVCMRQTIPDRFKVVRNGYCGPVLEQWYSLAVNNKPRNIINAFQWLKTSEGCFSAIGEWSRTQRVKWRWAFVS